MRGDVQDTRRFNSRRLGRLLSCENLGLWEERLDRSCFLLRAAERCEIDARKVFRSREALTFFTERRLLRSRRVRFCELSDLRLVAPMFASTREKRIAPQCSSNARARRR